MDRSSHSSPVADAGSLAESSPRAPASPRDSERARRVEHAAGVLLVALIALAPLMIGARHAGSRLVLTALGAAALALGLHARAIRARPIHVPLPAWLLLLPVLGCLLQLVPLPAALLRALSPAGAEVLRWAEGSAAIGGRPASLDPAGTFSELAKLCGYLCSFLAFAVYCRRTQRARRLELAVVATACLVTSLGLVQAGLDPGRILFFYEPQRSFGVWLRGTFVNPNHFGALVALAAPVALARALRARTRRALLGWVAALLLLDAATLLSLSRGAVLGAAVAHLVVLLWVARPRAGTPASAPRALGLLAATLVVAYFVVTGSDRFGPAMRVSSELDLQPVSKVQAWRAALPAIGQHPWIGQGRGAMATAFARHSLVAGKTTFPWLENAYLQVVLDFGAPLAAALFALLALSTWATARALRASPDRLGAVAGLAGLAVHELADFAVELPGVALPALALLAVATARRADESPPWTVTLRAWRLWPALAVVPLGLAAAELANRDADADARALADVASADPQRAAELARRLLRRHPADYALPLAVAEGLTRVGAPEALGWVNHAMFLNPHHPRPHVLAALGLLERGRRQQALLELRLAARGAARPYDSVWPVAARSFQGEELVALVGDDPALALGLAKYLRNREQRHAESGMLIAHAALVAPRDVRALQEAIAWHLGHREDGAPARADELLRRLLALDDGERSLALAVRTAARLGDPARALQYLERLPAGSATAFDTALELAREWIAAGALDRARAALAPAHAWDLNLRQRAALHAVMATLEERAGNPHRARWEAERGRALSLEPMP